ncbi:hypothetical protein CHS0354_019521 [Potamilus streckersoni]|uniref:Uncharacterized protein n=1 Tax=Potamilus streckersoni TaxID=2493646 RepID=A0AAE0VWL9_9BIVA|nr:hypothetical protein CHS0354_019521 [Potamilus streckersoni]
MTKYLVETYPIILHEADKGNRTPAHHDSCGGNVAVLAYIIDRGTDPWCRTSEEETLLHRACIHGTLEMTKYFVETYPKMLHEVDNETYPIMLHEVDNDNRTPAHHAAAGGNVAVLSYLIDRGTYPWCRTSEEETLLHRACTYDKLEMTKYFVETYPTMLQEVDNVDISFKNFGNSVGHHCSSYMGDRESMFYAI